jgi:starch phosphorylase
MMLTVGVGGDDIERAASALASRLPWPLGVLARLAYNYRWAWLPDGPEVFRAVDPGRWRECGGNPVRLLQETSAEALLRAAGDASLVARAEQIEHAVRDDLARPFKADVVAEDRPVAFFCAEYGVHSSLPIYSGGLGALAGDILKEASDHALPLVAVGLMYRRGYFRQRIDGSGWQQEFWVPTDPERSPAVLVTAGDRRAPLRITVPIEDSDVHAQVWRVDIGRIPLFLLDSDVAENSRVARWITGRLYDGDTRTRLAQYALLGAGGIATLDALAIEPGVVHINEGHAAFAALAMAGAEVRRGRSIEDALDVTRRRIVFTTHTPVAAGNDTYAPEEIQRTLRPIAAAAGIAVDDVIRLGRTHPDDEHEPFGVTQFALRASRAANGVSRRHGEVARAMWHELWPERALEGIPITHVTNGVHVASWVGAPIRRLLDRHLGERWAQRADDRGAMAAIDDVPASELWAARCEQRALLVDFVRDRSQLDRIARGEPREIVEAAARVFDPGVLTIGFARRLATYKRLHLLLHDLERAVGLLRGERAVQLLLAGKAHPKDDEAKRLVQQLFGARWEQNAFEYVVFLEDYDLGLAARLVRGCDLWINLPRPPLEASGTSGMKVAVNGGLQLSVLDGWWAEGYDGHNGWALDGNVDPDHSAQDARHAHEMYRLLEHEIVPEFYDRDDDGIPQAWIARVKRSMRTLIPAFSATRMLTDYETRIYRSPEHPHEVD